MTREERLDSSYENMYLQIFKYSGKIPKDFSKIKYWRSPSYNWDSYYANLYMMHKEKQKTLNL